MLRPHGDVLRAVLRPAIPCHRVPGGPSPVPLAPPVLLPQVLCWPLTVCSRWPPGMKGPPGPSRLDSMSSFLLCPVTSHPHLLGQN